MWFEIVGNSGHVEVIAAGSSIRIARRLRRAYGGGRWRKLEGFAVVRLGGVRLFWAEVHGYEAHGIGHREFKVKRLVRGMS